MIVTKMNQLKVINKAVVKIAQLLINKFNLKATRVRTLKT